MDMSHGLLVQADSSAFGLHAPASAVFSGHSQNIQIGSVHSGVGKPASWLIDLFLVEAVFSAACIFFFEAHERLRGKAWKRDHRLSSLAVPFNANYYFGGQ
jgi:hypothetical protein